MDAPDQGDEKGCRSDELDGACSEDGVAHLPQTLQAEFKADQEQEHCNAEFCDMPQRLGVSR